METTRKIALITGANRGLGLEIARQLGQRHYMVLLGARNAEAGRAAAAQLIAEGIEAECLVLDVTQADDVAQAVATVGSTYGKLDVLVNNAVFFSRDNQAASQIPTALLQQYLTTNFVAPVAVTQAFLPLLHQSAAGRIVNMSTSIGSLTTMGETIHTTPRMAAAVPLGYSSSKAALNMFTTLLAKELRTTPIKVNSADPGRTQTDMGGPEAPNTVEYGAKVAVWLACLDEDGPTGGFFSYQHVSSW
ncbi:SDR family NAD(P)-dependent oxidoreductase [Hymenobacter sp. H14-R3]|uniref:SDR family NAD(P)-dependent oxidoreductase n=1 Tax=Hymenobacter sp. H14-R3 TaxID=3046308 RepID=UPI0024B90285|nr:SDR family NAD(P)-dependent oxidoreductase [Hymenobacter sp. H14-R3]MDJ0367820.1 SDR family NAD(P)-dependent oxidoreductase [Hymenobacter sp. H14-R3]